MRILVLLVLLTMSSATIHKLFRPRKLYKHLVKPLFGSVLRGSHDEIDSLEHIEEEHGKKSKHRHKKHKEILIHHHMEPHYNHIQPYYHHMEQYHNIHNHIEPIHHVKPFYPSHQPFHQPIHSDGHVHEPLLSEGGIYGGTIGFHDELIGHGDEQLYHGSKAFSSHGSFHQMEGLTNHFPNIH